MKTAVITGASSGIGMATARLFASKGIALVICGRRKDKLDELSTELSAVTQVTSRCFDVRDKDAVMRELQGLQPPFDQPDILINNAGNAHGLDPIQDGNPDDWDAMIDINVKGLLNVTRAILPKMLAKNSGHIIHLGSTAGKEVYPKGNVYCASKHAVDAINQGMRLDLNGTGIRVGAINPGLVETNFSEVRFKGDSERAEKVYQGYTPLKAEDVAEIIYFMVSRPPHVNIADLTVMCTDQASSTIINKNT